MGKKASPRHTAEVGESPRAAQPQTMEFSRLLRTPPPAPEPAEESKRSRAWPRPLKAPPPQPTGPASLPRAKVFFFFFWRQISVTYFPGLSGDTTGGASQECGDSRGIDRREPCGPASSPIAPGRGRKKRGRRRSSSRCPRQDGGREKRGRGRQPTSVTANARGSLQKVGFYSPGLPELRRLVSGRQVFPLTLLSLPGSPRPPPPPRGLASASSSPWSRLLVGGNQLRSDGGSGCGLCGHRSPEVVDQRAE